MMYNTINKNYRIELFDGDEHFGFGYTDGMLDLHLNNISVVIIPYYDTSKLVFPPTEYLYEIIGEFPTSKNESRVMGFNKGDLVFFEFPEQENEIHKIEETEIINELELKFEKLICCVSTNNYQLLIKELPEILKEINPTSRNGSWQRNDVMNFASFQFIDEKLHEFVEFLPKRVKKSLEL